MINKSHFKFIIITLLIFVWSNSNSQSLYSNFDFINCFENCLNTDFKIIDNQKILASGYNTIKVYVEVSDQIFKYDKIKPNFQLEIDSVGRTKTIIVDINYSKTIIEFFYEKNGDFWAKKNYSDTIMNYVESTIEYKYFKNQLLDSSVLVNLYSKDTIISKYYYKNNRIFKIKENIVGYNKINDYKFCFNSKSQLKKYYFNGVVYKENVYKNINKIDKKTGNTFYYDSLDKYSFYYNDKGLVDAVVFKSDNDFKIFFFNYSNNN